jgi:hypothetical protein
LPDKPGIFASAVGDTVFGKTRSKSKAADRSVRPTLSSFDGNVRHAQFGVFVVPVGGNVFEG